MLDQVLRYKFIIDYLKKSKNIKWMKILEIWSWSQWIGKFLDISFDWLDETTSDYSWTEQVTNKNMHFIKWSALNIPSDSNTYDFVFSLDMLEHIPKNFRIKAFEEAIRVGSETIIFWFPCGIYANFFDHLLYFFIKKIFSRKKMVWWLEEHVKIWMPVLKEIEDDLKKLQIKYNFTYTSFWSANIFLWGIVIFFSFIKPSSYLNYISDIILKKNYSFKSNIPYRRFYIIQKKDD